MIPPPDEVWSLLYALRVRERASCLDPEGKVKDDDDDDSQAVMAVGNSGCMFMLLL